MGLCLAPGWIAARGAAAQDVAAGPTASTLALPDAPDDYTTERIGNVRWDYPTPAQGTIRDLQRSYRASWSRVVAELGQTVADDLVVRVGRNPEEMRALAPPEAPPPAYASGVAYPGHGLVLLTLQAPETWETPDLPTVLTHELSHIAFYRAVGDTHVPRWFSEGVAIYQARERSLERARVLWGGTVGGRLLSFERLNQRFPDDPRQVTLAYAQSADFVNWLRKRDAGERKFRDVIDRLARGQSFEIALRRTYSTNLTRLEIDWHDDLSRRYQAMPLLMGSGGLWVFAAFLVGLAYLRRRRRDRLKRAEWDAEDAEARALAEANALLTARMAQQPLVGGSAMTTSGPSPSADDRAHELLYVVPAEPRGADHGIPTVQHEGRSHTLH